VAETEQRFILRWSYRDLARNIGYPVGGLLLLVFIARPSGEAEDWWLLACGLAILLWTWFIDRRVRVEVTEQKVTVVNLFSRYEVPWSALHGIDLRAVGFHSGGEPLIYCLDFVTLSEPPPRLPNTTNAPCRDPGSTGTTAAPLEYISPKEVPA
jgi:hypothetical protein